MPWLSFGGGRLALAYYESRGLLGGIGGIGIQDQDLSGLGFISGIDRVVDFRAALLEPGDRTDAGHHSDFALPDRRSRRPRRRRAGGRHRRGSAGGLR